jgi:hypothetical protein
MRDRGSSYQRMSMADVPQMSDMQVREWKPIASAPKDGTKIDVWFANDFGGSRWTDVWWRDPGSLGLSAHVKPGWAYDYPGYGIENIGENVTHWMLPPEGPRR